MKMSETILDIFKILFSIAILSSGKGKTTNKQTKKHGLERRV